MSRITLAAVILFCLLSLPGCETRAEYDAEGLFKQVSPSIVTILAFDEKGHQEGQGSGVVIDKGRIVTNCHVVREAHTLKVASGTQEYAATWAQADPSRDICLIKAEAIKAPPLDFRKSDDVKIGETVFAVGNPLGFGLSVSTGLISTLSPYRDEKVIVANVALSPGSSGGGLFDNRGRLLGITTAILTAGQNLNIVLPADWIADLKKRGVAPPPPTIVPKPEPRWIEEAKALESAVNYLELEKHVRKWREAQPSSSLAAGYLYVALADSHPAEAELALRESVRLDDRNAHSWVMLADLLHYQGRKDEAVKALQKAQLLSPNQGGIYLAKAVWLLADGKLQDAYDAAQDAIRLEPSHVDSWRKLAVIADRLGHAEESAKAYRTALRLNPLDDTLKQALSDVLARNGKADAARLNVPNPSSAETWVSMGFTELNRNRYSDAEKAFRKAIEISSENWKAWVGLGTVLQQTNRNQEAGRAYDKAYEHRPDDPKIVAEILTNRSNVKSALGDKLAAVKDLQAALQSAPSYINAGRSLGILAMESRDYRAAVEVFRKVVASDIAGVDDWSSLAEALVVLGDKPQAIEALKKAEKLDPNNLRVMRVFTKYYGDNGDHQKALDYIERALKIDSSDARSWSSKGYALLKLGRLPESVSALETAVNLDPQFPSAWVNLGEAQMRSNNMGKAISALEKALALAPSSADARLYLALSYLGSWQSEKARTQANILLKANPDFPRALAVLTLSYLMDNNVDAALKHYQKIQAINPQMAKAVRETAVSQGLAAAKNLHE